VLILDKVEEEGGNYLVTIRNEDKTVTLLVPKEDYEYLPNVWDEEQSPIGLNLVTRGHYF